MAAKRESNVYDTVDGLLVAIQRIFDDLYTRMCERIGKTDKATRARLVEVTTVNEINNPAAVAVYRQHWDRFKKKASRLKGGRYQQLFETNTKPLITEDLDVSLKGPQEHCDQLINEVYLFFTAEESVLDKVIQGGFSDDMKSGPYGNAIHFAESPHIADTFADAWYTGQKGKRRMLLARVILGRTYVHRLEKSDVSTVTALPCTKRGCMKQDCAEAEHQDRFNSAMVCLKKGTRLQLMLHAERCIPEFVITYRSSQRVEEETTYTALQQD